MKCDKITCRNYTNFSCDCCCLSTVNSDRCRENNFCLFELANLTCEEEECKYFDVNLKDHCRRLIDYDVTFCIRSGHKYFEKSLT